MTQKRGFQLMTPERLKEVTSMGGKKVHLLNLGHKWTSSTAKKASMIAKKHRDAKKK